MMDTKDFTPTKEQISLHGLGFIQVILPGNQRLHVWHPDLPRRSCYEYSSIHNHRFGFESRVLIGTQVNRRYDVYSRRGTDGTHDRISHDGPRSEKGGRLSYVADQVGVSEYPDELYEAGQSYSMPALQYHETPNDGIVVTLMRKMVEGEIHASSLIARGHEFDQSFDRFALSPDELWTVVLSALKHGGA